MSKTIRLAVVEVTPELRQAVAWRRNLPPTQSASDALIKHELDGMIIDTITRWVAEWEEWITK